MSKFRTHYDNLKIARNAPDSIIRSAYKILMQQYHPDKYTGNMEDGIKISKMINDAYNVLIDPVKRAKHDQWILEQEDQLKSVNTEKLKNKFDQIDYLIHKEENLYEIATKELISNTIDHAVMGKAIINANGNETKIFACYIKIRFNELFDEAVDYCLNELMLLGCQVSQKSIFGVKKWIITTNWNSIIEINTLDELISITKIINIEDQERKKNQQIIKQKEQEDILRKQKELQEKDRAEKEKKQLEAKRTLREIDEENRLNKIKEFENLNLKLNIKNWWNRINL
jgi:curved DNA-binding protein CbpA